MVYGQRIDLLFLKVAGFFLCAALADLTMWAGTRSATSLLGPGSLLVLCLVYLEHRRRFRRTVRQDLEQDHPDDGGWLGRPEPTSGDSDRGPSGYELSA